MVFYTSDILINLHYAPLDARKLFLIFSIFSSSISLCRLFDFRQRGVVKVDMPKVVEDAISEVKSATPADAPAGSDLLAVLDSAELLGKSAREDFHSRVAKLLHLAKQTRPDILLPINFLCTRV
jgi:hypothetical protein